MWNILLEIGIVGFTFLVGMFVTDMLMRKVESEDQPSFLEEEEPYEEPTTAQQRKQKVQSFDEIVNSDWRFGGK